MTGIDPIISLVGLLAVGFSIPAPVVRPSVPKRRPAARGWSRHSHCGQRVPRTARQSPSVPIESLSDLVSVQVRAPEVLRMKRAQTMPLRRLGETQTHAYAHFGPEAL